MEVIIHLEIKKIDTNYEKAIKEYTKRLSAFCKTKINICKSLDNVKLQKNSYTYLVLPDKKTLSSTQLANKITSINMKGYSCIEFVIPKDTKEIIKNVIPNFAERNIENFSISSFGFDTDLTCVVLTEQIYRAYTINNNITYHK